MQKTDSTIKTPVVRPPVVVVMGHIDHGKTTLLDYIRKANVTKKEAGGITQHTGAYEVLHNDKRITFIDTPGHAAFSEMRSRGARIADVAVLVVAADDSIMPQTKEALAAIDEAKIPFVVAINKIDKPNADTERVKRDFMQGNIFLEGQGGTVPWVAISAKEGKGVDQLLETILLMAEIEELSMDTEKFASGIVIESHLDSKRGNAATLLLQDGTLRIGNFVVAEKSVSKVRIMEDFSGGRIDLAEPSSPVVVVGFDSLPPVGVLWNSFENQKTALATFTEDGVKQTALERFGGTTEGEKKHVTINMVIKSNTEGAASALKDEIAKLASELVSIVFLRVGAGEISDDDIKIAASGSQSFILAFHTQIANSAKELADRLGVSVVSSDIIYEIIDKIKIKVAEAEPKIDSDIIVGKVKILKVFSAKGYKQVIGGRVLEGTLSKGNLCEIVRRENVIGNGSVENLQSGKVDVNQVGVDSEFGAVVASKEKIAPGDELILRAR
jgi:translation initiation factor IF-2